MHESGLFVNLALALAAAWIGAVVAVRLRQSPILGYIFAGIVIGPNTPGFVGDIHTVEDLANIGVILLMFTIGIHVSLRDLMRVSRIAVTGGVTQVLIMIGIGTIAGKLLGWGALESVFFGGVLAISSGVVMSRILGERGELGSAHGQIALGWSAVQDFATIVLIVVLMALAEGDDNLTGDVAWAVGKAGLFLAILIPAGSRLLPWLFEQVAAMRNREVFLLTIAATALGAAYLSSFFGLSLALGAFVGGLIISESDLSHQILADIEPLRDIFVGLFFVSVGMLIDPAFVAQHLPAVLFATALVVVGKGFLVTLLVRLLGASWRTAALAGAALSQAGEFSFLIAQIGATLNVISPDAFSLILAASVLSIVLTPAVVWTAEPDSRWVEVHLPLGRSVAPELSAPATGLRGHAVVCGYGRVGQIIGDALQRRGFPMIVIEEDQRIVRQLRESGVRALYGSADHPAIMELVHLEHARVLVIAVPDAYSARRIIDNARRINPRLDIVARTHSHHERRILQERGVSEIVMGEMELALEMTRFTLHRFGVDAREIQASLQRLRLASEDPDAPAGWL